MEILGDYIIGTYKEQERVTASGIIIPDSVELETSTVVVKETGLNCPVEAGEEVLVTGDPLELGKLVLFPYDSIRYNLTKDELVGENLLVKFEVEEKIGQLYLPEAKRTNRAVVIKGKGGYGNEDLTGKTVGLIPGNMVAHGEFHIVFKGDLILVDI